MLYPHLPVVMVDQGFEYERNPDPAAEKRYIPKVDPVTGKKVLRRTVFPR